MNDKFTWEAGDLVFDISDDDELFRALPGYDDEIEIDLEEIELEPCDEDIWGEDSILWGPTVQRVG